MVWDLNLSRAADAAHGKFGHVIIDRQLVTAQVTSLDGDFDKDTGDGSGLGAKIQNNLPGIAKGQYKIDAIYSPAMDFQMEPFKNRQSPFFAAVAMRGLAAGSPIQMMPASFGKWSPKITKKDEGTVSFELMARNDFHNGRILLSPKTTLSGASGLGPVDDNTPYGGPTTFGGCFYFWVSDIVGGTAPTFTPKVQHCTTSGGTYTDLAVPTVAASMATPSTLVQQIYVPSTTTVNAFTQISWTATGSPTAVQVVGGFARDYDPSL